MLNKTLVLLVILGLVFLFCVVMLVLDNSKKTQKSGFANIEKFQDPPEDITKIQQQLDGLTDEQLEGVVGYMKEKLVKYNLLPEQRQLAGASLNAQTPGPRVDLSQYMKKSSCPPQNVCPPQKEIDYSQYVKRSTIQPAQACAPCVAPKVKVSANLCKKCPECPPPPPCPTCPTMTCPEPKPCPVVECPKCSEIKYIKVPTIITRTIMVDANNNVISEEVAGNNTEGENTSEAENETAANNSAANNSSNTSEEESTATSPMRTNYKVPETTRTANKMEAEKCNVVGLNSEFRKYGIYGLE